jgi:hypothetical protein
MQRGAQLAVVVFQALAALLVNDLVRDCPAIVSGVDPVDVPACAPQRVQ